MTTRKEKMFSSFTEAKRPTSCSGSGLHKVADEELALFCFFKAAAAILFQLLQCLQIFLQMYFAATARKCLALISASDIQGVSKKRYFLGFIFVSVPEVEFYFFTCVL